MNFKNLTVGKKIALGFGMVLVFLCAVGLLSFTGVKGIVLNATHVIDGNRLDGMLAQREIDHLSWTAKVDALLTDEAITELDVQTDHHKCGFGQWLYGEDRLYSEKLVPSLAPLLKSIEQPHEKLHASAIAIGKAFRHADPKLPALFLERHIDHLDWAAKIRNAFLNNESRLNVQTDPTQCALGKWLKSEEAERAYQAGDRTFRATWDEMLSTHRSLHQSALKIDQLIDHSQAEAKMIFFQATTPLLTKTVQLIDQLGKEAEHDLDGMRQAGHIYAAQTMPALEEIRTILHDIRKQARQNVMTDEVMLAAAQGTQRNVTIVSIIAILAGVLFAFFTSKGIVGILSQITLQMEEGADQVASASSQVASASQSLAEGASEQAASIEETSSALEEMSSMTRQNADNANQANSLMKEANQVVDNANGSMQKLTDSMGQIANASEETSKIIKTIDEIAFQTNLLALNAAVEAARAGEAGAGFAVVADEVRNLAMRAADAAKNTSELIESTVKKVEDGSTLVAETDKAFSRVARDVAKVSDLVSEINAASNEQAQGIGQVNQAVTEMDKVIQQNAASAEESASASEEMNAQAMQMKAIVDHLMTLVGGHRAAPATQHPMAGGTGRRPSGLAAMSGAPAGGNNGHKKNGHHAKGGLPVNQNMSAKEFQMRQLSPEEVIPLDDGSFEDF